jgi:hypothetical protein
VSVVPEASEVRELPLLDSQATAKIAKRQKITKDLFIGLSPLIPLINQRVDNNTELLPTVVWRVNLKRHRYTLLGHMTMT